jgi:hypothetical protein
MDLMMLLLGRRILHVQYTLRLVSCDNDSQPDQCLGIFSNSSLKPIDFESKHIESINDFPRTSSVDSSETNPRQEELAWQT